MSFQETSPLSNSEVLLFGRPPSVDPRIESELMSIGEALKKAVGKEKIIEIRSPVQEKNGQAFSPLDKLKLARVPCLVERRNYPRDAHLYLTEFGDNFIINPGTWILSYRNSDFSNSNLGESGAVIHSRDIVLTTSKRWNLPNTINMREKLSGRGYLMDYLPYVDPVDGNVQGHIDGHAALIEEKEGNIVLLVAESYYQQNSKTMQRISEVGLNTRVDIRAVKTNLPLELNLVQFRDGKVVMTGGTKETQTLVEDLVGKDKVITTNVPIQWIPKRRSAGIRCITNIIPSFLAAKEPRVSYFPVPATL